MKFERHFLQHQLPKWAPFYLNYHALKAMIKIYSIQADGDIKDVQLEEIYVALLQGAEVAGQFYAKRLATLVRRRADLHEKYSLRDDGANNPSPSQEYRESLRTPLAFLVELSKDVGDLQRFRILNEAAIQRIAWKIKRLDQSDTRGIVSRLHVVKASVFARAGRATSALKDIGKNINRLVKACSSENSTTSESLAAPTADDPIGISVGREPAADNLQELSQPYLQSNGADSTSLILSRDDEGSTPLHHAVIDGSPEDLESLLQRYGEVKPSPEAVPVGETLRSVLGELLLLAARLAKPAIIRSLLRHDVDVDCRGSSGETALYVATQFGHLDVVKALLNATPTPNHHHYLDMAENWRGWTPLFIAAVRGHFHIAKYLIDSGSAQETTDLLGWSAKEHAAYRGHLKIATLFATPCLEKPCLPHSHVTDRHDLFSVEKRQESGLAFPFDATTLPVERPWSKTEAHLLITIGSPNLRDDLPAVDMDAYFNGHAAGSVLDTVLTVKVHAVGARPMPGARGKVVLPIVEDTINQPWHFATDTPDQVKIVMTISSSVNGKDDESEVLGSGIALVNTLKHSLASDREGLARYYSIPLLEKNTLRFMGTVTFGMLLVNPSPATQSIPRTPKRGFWKEGGPTQVVGHRGSGANTAARTNLQLGENTVQSYLSAAQLGATAVEFDVQLTKDLVPVIFHDFLVMEAGGDTPIYTLRLNQFQHLSEAQRPRGELSRMAEARYMERNRCSGGANIRPRSYSLAAYDESRNMDLAERMGYTESAMAGDHKGNIRGESIQGGFPTLEGLFTHLPESISFNVEMKYPMLWEAEDRNMDHFAPEINAYVDVVLSTIYRLAGKRSITFSSFSPEVCILLTIKQQAYPVLFLSKAGSVPVGDIRCSGLQQSIRFAKTWGLAGIVILSDLLVMCPRLVQYAKDAGLKVCSYGPLNNDPECAKIQANAGLDVIIVDKVRLISEALSGGKPS